MKNYPHLYPNPIHKKVTQLNRTPKKNSTFTGNALNSKASQKTMLTYNTLNREKHSQIRNLTRSIQDIRVYSDASNEQKYENQFIGATNDDEELFSQSYSKIGQIKQACTIKNIDLQLNEVLKLIKQQKIKITEKMKTLKKSNDHYKMLCERYLIGKNQCAINTQNIIDLGSQVLCLDQGISCQIIKESIKILQQETMQQHQQLQKPMQQPKANLQAYKKIAKMLVQMNINPKDVLPYQNVLPQEVQVTDFNTLSQKQIIKIQKFFIKKLLEKIPK